MNPMGRKPLKKKVKVRFEPDNIDIVVEQGKNLMEAAIDAGVHITASCGGSGVCGTCKVLIKQGEVECSRTKHVTEEEYKQGIRQACQSRVKTDSVVFVPVSSRLETAILKQEKSGSYDLSKILATGWRFHPLLSKLFVELPKPSMEDNISDLSRLLRGLKQWYNLNNVSADFCVLKKLPEVLRQGKWKGTVTLIPDGNRHNVTNIEPGDTTQSHYSLAFDIGTTTICGQLLDLNQGKVLAEGMNYNGQISYGRDVIARIAYCAKPNGLEKLRQAAVATINGIIRELLDSSKIDVDNIAHMVVAGNTTMIQILFGLDPKHIRLAPYTPTANVIPPVSASYLDIEIGDCAYLHSLPLVASYIGADIVAGVVGTRMHQRKKLTLYIDLGTNGEIVLGNKDWMATASCSAGPVFEGGGVKHGMIATAGAIEGFDIDRKTLEPTIRTIGDVKPVGICGTGLINITAKLLESGVLGQNGKFHTQLPTKRVRKGADGYEYVLAWGTETQIGKDIVITEVDIDNLIRAKAAMYAGCETLTDSVNITFSDVEQVIIAGAFGSHIDIENSITIGLLPDIPRKRFISIGNGSLSGARLASFSIDILNTAERVARMMTNFELSVDMRFMDNYTASLFLPHPNAEEFPSVYKKLTKIIKKRREDVSHGL